MMINVPGSISPIYILGIKWSDILHDQPPDGVLISHLIYYNLYQLDSSSAQ